MSIIAETAIQPLVSPPETPQKKKKSTAMRKLLIGATLSTALVSFFSTAQGMSMYIFATNLVFSFVISGAVQGTLYTLSISGLPLLRSKFFRGLPKKAILILFWIALLLTSSVFSYVYISKTAYPDEVFRSDAEQNMILFIRDTSNELLEQVRRDGGLEDEKRMAIIEYVNILGFNRDDSAQNNPNPSQFTNPVIEVSIDSYINQLTEYEGNTVDGDTEINLGKYFSPTTIIRFLNVLKTGQYTDEDIANLQAEIDYYIGKDSVVSTDVTRDADGTDDTNDADSSVDNDGEVPALIEGINECDNIIADNNTKLDDYNERQKTFHNLTHPEYLRNQSIIQGLEAEIRTYRSLKHTLESIRTLLGDIRRFLEESFLQGVDNQLRELTKSLFKEINKENIDTSVVLSISEDIYNELLEGNVSGSDRRITEYGQFKQDMIRYREYIDVRQSLENELELLSSYIQSQDESNAGDSSQNSDGNWKDFWSERLANLLYSSQVLPSVVSYSDSDVTDGEGVVTNIDKSFNNKSEINQTVTKQKRLYLVGLNDFERGMSLLHESFWGFHKQGTMVIVSLFFAFGLDLFSLGMGILLYFFKANKPDKKPRKT